ncbi:MAG: sigma-54 dependent transcriptional regulator [Bryobacteraceae bacterium]|nr:sigma-54 dependent transcriptional regulator [Bryobacteraceae bacterium]
MGTSTLTPSGWDNKAAGASRMAATLDPSRHVLVGQSPRMRQVMRMAEKLGKCRWPVLLLGETGAGKEVVARAVHQVENVGPFVTIDCSSMVGPLMESELFGHVKGAFTGAAGAKVGLIEHANGGTAFFDEIGELPLDLQAKLLRVIQEKEFRPVGSLFHRRSDFRVIAATNRDLAKEVEKGTFRRDLYYRLNVVSLRLPPLRERKEDVPSLIAHFLERCGGTHRLTQDALEAMLSYEWPGNVRELENCIQHMIAVNSGPLVHVTDLPSSLQHWLAQRNGQYRTAAASYTAGPAAPAEPSYATSWPTPEPAAENPIVPLVELERKAIMQALQHTRGDRATAATLLGIGRTTLYRKLKEYRIAG